MSYRIKTGFKVLLLVSLVAIAFVGCEMSVTDEVTGTLTISLQDEVNSRSIEPILAMDVATFRISGTRAESSDSVGPVEILAESTDDYTFENVPIGLWTITIEAFNDDSTPAKIGQGTNTIQVLGGVTNNVTVNVLPLDGTGDFAYTIDWSNNAIANPQIDAFLTIDTTSSEVAIAPQDIYIDTTGKTMTITVDDLPEGYYDFRYVIKNGTTALGGDFHTVRILAGQESTGSVIMPALPADMAVLVNDLCTPFTVEITSIDTVMEKVSLQTFTVAPVEDTSSYQWYLDGEKITDATGAEYDVYSEELRDGWHNLAVRVEHDDSMISSDTFAFYKDPESGNGGWIDVILTKEEDAPLRYTLTSGPSDDPSIAFFGTFTEYEIPSHLVLDILGAGLGSLNLASSVPTVTDGEGTFTAATPPGYPCVSSYIYALGVTDDNAVGIPQTNGMLQISDTPSSGLAKVFDSKRSFPNDNGSGGSLYDLTAVEDLIITYTEFGSTAGSYIRGTVSGQVISDLGTTFEVYDVEGTFVTTNGTPAAMPQ